MVLAYQFFKLSKKGGGWEHDREREYNRRIRLALRLNVIRSYLH